MLTQPSPRWYPFAQESNVWHRPRVDSIPAIENIENATRELRIMLLPIDRACTHSQRAIWLTARSVATRLDEHAVSTATHGPRIANTKDRRAPAPGRPFPVISYGPGTREIRHKLSEFIIPSATPTSALASAVQARGLFYSVRYPTCSTRNCCGSIGAASAGLTRKKLASNLPPCSKKAAYQRRSF